MRQDLSVVLVVPVVSEVMHEQDDQVEQDLSVS